MGEGGGGVNLLGQKGKEKKIEKGAEEMVFEIRKEKRGFWR